MDTFILGMFFIPVGLLALVLCLIQLIKYLRRGLKDRK